MRSTWKNFAESDLPLLERVRLLGVNSWWKASHRSPCCGHYGEPGC